MAPPAYSRLPLQAENNGQADTPAPGNPVTLVSPPAATRPPARVVPTSPDHAPAGGAWRPRLALLAALGLTWALPLSTLGSESLWRDEAWTWFQSGQSLPRVILLSVDIEPHPPLYYLIVHFVMQLAGSSEFALRFASAAAGPLLVAGGYALARSLAPRAAPWAAWLLAVYPMQVYYGQFARSYALAGAATILAAACFERAARRPGWSWTLGFAGTVLLVGYLHVLALLPVAGFCLARLVSGGRRPAKLIWALVMIVVGLLPWGVLLIRHTLLPAVPEWRSTPPLGLFLSQVWAVLAVGPGYERVPALLTGLAAVPTIWLLIVGVRGGGRQLTGAGLVGALGSIVLLGIASIKVPVYHERYLSVFVPMLAVAAAGGLVRPGRRSALLGTTACLIGAVNSVWLLSGALPNDNLRGLTRDLSRQVRPGDVVLVSPASAWIGLAYYAGPELAWQGVIGRSVTSIGSVADEPARAPVYGIGFIDQGPVRASDVYPVTPWPAAVSALAGLTERAERIWWARVSDTVSDPSGRVLADVESRWRQTEVRAYPGSGGVQLRLYRTRPPESLLTATGFYQAERPVPGLGQLVGWRWAPALSTAADAIALQLLWRADQGAAADLRTFVHVLDQAGQQVGGRDVVTGSTGPADAGPGAYLLDDIELRGPPDDSSQAVEIGLYSARTGERLRIGDADSVTVGFVPGGLAAASEAAAVAQFEPGITLAKVRLPPAPVAPGSDVALRLAWRFARPIGDDTTVFVHLVDASGRPLAQADGPIFGGLVPSDRITPGDVVWEERYLRLPPDLPTGRWRLLIGLYSRRDGTRLQLVGSPDSGNAAPIGTLEVGDR